MSASLMTARFGELPFVRSENRTALHARLPDASFDKCSVLEIKNSALFLAIAVSDIKDIKRGQTFSATLERPGRDIERRSARLIIDYFWEIKNSAPFLANVVPEIKQIKQIKRRRTLSAATAGGGGGGRCRDPDMTSIGFDFFQTDSRQSVEF